METAIEPKAFTKMSGCGNDFIVMDNRTAGLDPSRHAELARNLCRRRVSVGADGLILIENDPEVDFRWRFFNRDGTEGEMCGNGARCAARYAYLKGIVTDRRLRFRTLAGIIRAEILNGRRVKVQVTEPSPATAPVPLRIAGEAFTCHCIDTGVPHAVVFIDSPDLLKTLDVERWGKALRYHPCFEPLGTNVDFVAVVGRQNLELRTYERGVEEETLACGTGAVAAALVSREQYGMQPPVRVTTSGSEVLTIHFDGATPRFSEVYLEGEARVIYEGQLWEEPSIS